MGYLLHDRCHQTMDGVAEGIKAMFPTHYSNIMMQFNAETARSTTGSGWTYQFTTKPANGSSVIGLTLTGPTCNASLITGTEQMLFYVSMVVLMALGVFVGRLR